MSNREHFFVYKKNPSAGQVRASPSCTLSSLDAACVELSYQSEGTVYFVRENELRKVQLSFSEDHVYELVVQHVALTSRRGEAARTACAVKFTEKSGSPPDFAVLVLKQEYDTMLKCHFNRVVFIGMYEHAHKRLALTVGDDALKTDTAVSAVMANLKERCTVPSVAVNAASGSGGGAVDRPIKRMRTAVDSSGASAVSSSGASAAAVSSLGSQTGFVVFDTKDDDDDDMHGLVSVRPYYAPYGRTSVQGGSLHRRTQGQGTVNRNANPVIPLSRPSGAVDLKTMARRIDIPAPNNETVVAGGTTGPNIAYHNVQIPSDNNNRGDQPTRNGGFMAMVRSASTTLRGWCTGAWSALKTLWEIGCDVVGIAVNLWPFYLMVLFLIVIFWVVWYACKIAFIITSWGSSGHDGQYGTADGVTR